MKILKSTKVMSMVLPLAISTVVIASPSSYANCDEFEGLNAESTLHLAELCDAADAGHAGAIYWLGLAYIEGHVLNDYDQGLAWFKKAAFLGNEEAQRMYEFISSAEVGPGC